MKIKAYVPSIFLCITSISYAQPPQAINYQGVARNSNGVPLVNHAIGLRLSILDSLPTGTSLYSETHSLTTGQGGLFNLAIGSGNVVSGNFDSINWGRRNKWLKTEIDTSGGSNYQLLGTTQFLSVPYSLFSKNSGNGLPAGAHAGDMLYWNDTTWVKLPVGPDGLSLVLCNGIPTWGGCPITLTTSSVSSISYTSAVSGGSITNNNSVFIIASGVCYDTSSNPTVSNFKTTDGNGTSFSSTMSGLSINKTYYVRAYAVSSFGTTYGNTVSFTTLAQSLPILTTTAATSISTTTANSGGNITNDGGAAVTARGTCWNTLANPTILNSHTIDGSGNGSFTSNITGLVANTTYFVRAYATNSQGTSYGNQISFTTLPTIPSLTTTNAGNIGDNSAVSGGNISSNGGAAVTSRGVCWSTSTNPTTANSLTNDGTGNGTFTSNISGLSGTTTYFVRAYATNSQGTAYGNQISFTTLASVPTLTTNNIVNITPASAQSGGNISNNGGSTVTARGLCWSTTINPTIANSLTSNGSGSGSFSGNIIGLLPSTTYYVRAYATNSQGTAYGNQISFTTLNPFAIGQTYQGGNIFYIDGTGLHGLIASTTDLSLGIQWFNTTYILLSNTGTAIGTGLTNTNTIVSVQGTGNYAAKLCSDLVQGGFSDWFLPSKDELDLMFTNRTSIGGMPNYPYWSSSECYNTASWAVSFSGMFCSDKSATQSVRAIRAF